MVKTLFLVIRRISPYGVFEFQLSRYRTLAVFVFEIVLFDESPLVPQPA